MTLPSHSIVQDRAEQHFKRIEAVREELEQGLTFRPVLVAKRPAAAASASMAKASPSQPRSADERIGGDGGATSPAASGSPRAGAGTALASLPVEHRLYDQAQELRRRQEERSKAGGTEGCTFAPHLTARAKGLSRPGTASDRLYDPEWVRKRAAPERNDPSRRGAEGFDFRPRINPSPGSGAAGSGSPSHAGAAEGGGGEDAGDAKPSSSAPGTPTPTRGGGRDDRGPVHDRLFSEGARQAVRLQAAKAKRAQEELSGATFRPDTAASRASAALVGIKTSTTTTTTSGDGAEGGGEGAEDAHARLYRGAVQQRQRQKDREAAPPAADPACTFAPELNAASRKMASAHQQAAWGGEGEGGEQQQPRHEALYQEGISKVRAAARPITGGGVS